MSQNVWSLNINVSYAIRIFNFNKYDFSFESDVGNL